MVLVGEGVSIMRTFDRELAIKLILDGIPSAAAIAAASSWSEALDDFGLQYWMKPAGRLGEIPDPACVAKHLEGIARPKREDVERALNECSR